MKALQDHDPSIAKPIDIVDTLVEALKEERKTGRFPREKFGKKDEPSTFKIGIVGGGISGLYTAFILKHLGIDYEILEANADRMGGRIYTHHFSEKAHDYYDIGAMRFPNSPIMARTFDLFRLLKMGEPGKPRDSETVLIPYYMTGRNCPTRYNDITALTQTEDDPFKVSTANGGTVPATRVSHKVTAEILDDAYDLARIMAATEARQRAYEYLMRHDKFSLRDYLQNVEGYDPETVHWLETTDSASGWYDMAFTENVLESLAFAYNDASNQNKEEKPTKWWCIDGGTSVMIKRLLEKLDQDKIFRGKVVNKMVLDGVGEDKKLPPHKVVVTTSNYHTHAEETHTYSAVINTTTLGALQKMDLTGMELPYGMKTAIRVLRYDTSTKVGIRFKTMWWKNPGFDIVLGGVAKTDLPIRVCVYPSYNIHDSGPGVLLASYTWGQDSERIAAHVSTNSPHDDKGLKELMIYNLARLHTLNARFVENRRVIAENWDTHHAWDWSKDEFSAGAFALFAPGQFSTLIPHLLRPASDGRFVVVGEHASANHAWIVGALDSAVRGLKQILTRFNMEAELGRMIEVFGDVDELKQEQVAKQVIISMLTEEQMARLRLGRPIQAVAQVMQT
ncbi:amine oxidase [Melanomma pulvis-pyrius CBS 109.77]|uniref:Amine oxidase n=1 Tax=Melanomma pulvis-pyrius CBS 109.77 TaxID=1314802 RepID=A0A6A6X126_9PLEO|nr:amine oxidase [Melanomma pulvis-pyrius CBS 109.77]